MNKIEETLVHHQHYKQECNVSNRTIFCKDNLQVLQGINSECVDLIYLDPPFNKKKIFAAPIGSSAEGASFKDIFTKEDIKDDWLKTIEEDHYAIHELLNAVKRIESRTSYNFCYLAYMAIRLIEMHRVLKSTGSLYLHCDPTMSHYLKLLLDCIFGEKNFRNEVVWSYPASPSNSTRDFPRKHDIVLRYVKTSDFVFNQKDISIPYSQSSKERIQYGAYASKVMGGTEIKLREEGKLPTTVWQDIQQTYRYRNEHKKYPTQKPSLLLERIISASSNKGDMVLDPFCGCATTCVAAEKKERQWIGIDISVKAYELVQQRLKTEVYDQILLKGKEVQSDYNPVKPPDINFSTDPPKRTDSGAYSVDAKYVYVISHPLYPDEYKVGIASDPKSRLNQYQTGDPERSLKIEYQIRVANYRKLEDYIHKTFPNKHEWVHGNLQEIIDEIKQNAITQGDEGELL